MTVSSQTSRVSYAGNGLTTAFAVSFYFLADSHLKVILRAADGSETVKTLTTDYTVSGAGNPSGGTVTMGTAPASGTTLVIVRNVPLTQETDYQANDPFPAESHERALDKLTMENQGQQLQIDRALKVPETDPTSVSTDLPSSIARAGTVLAFDETGAPVAGPDVASVGTVLANIENINIVAGIDAEVTTVAGIASDVTTVAGISADVTAVADNETNIDAVAGNATNINAVAGNATNINAVAANETDIDTVAANVADVTTVAENIADINTVADNIVDVTNFADVYLGPKTGDPSVRNDGSPLQSGDLYFNTTENALRAYSGTVWVAGTAGTVGVQRFSGDGSDTTFTLATAPAAENNTQVYVSGVYQQKDTYSVSGTTLTFSSAPPSGSDNIEVVTIATLALGETDAALVSYLPAGAGAVERDVQNKLREVVSVNDFGAVGDGVTDDTAAIQAAINSCSTSEQTLCVPPGEYVISSTLMIQKAGFVFTSLSWSGVKSFNVTEDQSNTRIRFIGTVGDPAIRVQGSSTNFVIGAVIEGIEFVGGHVHTNTYTPNFTARGVGVRGANYGFVLESTQSWSPQLIDCSTYDVNGIHYDLKGNNQALLWRCSANNSNLTASEKPLSRAAACVRIGAEADAVGDHPTSTLMYAIRDCDFECAYVESVIWIVRGWAVTVDGNYIEARGDYETTLGYAAWPDQVIRIGDSSLSTASERNIPRNINISNNFVQCNTGNDATSGYYQDTDFVRIESSDVVVVENNNIRNSQNDCAIAATGTPIQSKLVWRNNTYYEGNGAGVIGHKTFEGTTGAKVEYSGSTLSYQLGFGGDAVNIAGQIPECQIANNSGQAFLRYTANANPQRFFRAKSRSSAPDTYSKVLNGDTLVEDRYYADDGTQLLHYFRQGTKAVADATTGQVTAEWEAHLMNGSGVLTKRLSLNYVGSFAPGGDNSQNLGTASFRWAVVFAGTGTINTSDEREKQQIKPIDEAALRAWAKVEYCQFKFNDAVESKASGARWHFGLIAQRVKEAFESEGLDPFAYGILCYDEWDEQPEVRNDDGEVTQEYRAAGSRYGIRYEEALALECAYLRSKLSSPN